MMASEDSSFKAKNIFSKLYSAVETEAVQLLPPCAIGKV